MSVLVTASFRKTMENNLETTNQILWFGQTLPPQATYPRYWLKIPLRNLMCHHNVLFNLLPCLISYLVDYAASIDIHWSWSIIIHYPLISIIHWFLSIHLFVWQFVTGIPLSVSTSDQVDQVTHPAQDWSHTPHHAGTSAISQPRILVRSNSGHLRMVHIYSTLLSFFNQIQ